MDKDKAMALLHARNAVVRALREVEAAHFEVESVGYSASFFCRIKTDLGMLAGRLHGSAHKEWRGRKDGALGGSGATSMRPLSDGKAAKSNLPDR
ncbi:MAG: hypothetical protein WA813_10005 [Beijerinckiaceae bacterium]